MRWTGSGPEGIDPGNGLEHPARGLVGRKAIVHFFSARGPRLESAAGTSSRGDWPPETSKLGGCGKLIGLYTLRGEGDSGTPQTRGGIEAALESSSHDWS